MQKEDEDRGQWKADGGRRTAKNNNKEKIIFFAHFQYLQNPSIGGMFLVVSQWRMATPIKLLDGSAN